MKAAEQRFEKITAKYGDTITGPDDLTAGQRPTGLCYLLADKLRYLLDADPERAVPRSGMGWRRRLHPVIKALGPRFLPCAQILENRNALKNPQNPAPDPGISLPAEPVIWMPNHRFRDDPLASVLAAKRHAYIVFGSLPQFFNTVDGVTAWLNGIVMLNRRADVSRKTSVSKAVRTLRCGTDVIIYPEGILNKYPHVLTLPLWPGIYRVACETGARVVPIVHYIRDPDRRSRDNPIHTVIDDPIRIDDLGERAALDYLRDMLATWFYLMMEAYGKTTREELQGDFPSLTEAWEQKLTDRVGLMDRYDREIELRADYRPKDILRPEDVWQPVADIRHITPQNAAHAAYAQNLVTTLRRQDFQRRF